MFNCLKWFNIFILMQYVVLNRFCQKHHPLNSSGQIKVNIPSTLWTMCESVGLESKLNILHEGHCKRRGAKRACSRELRTTVIYRFFQQYDILKTLIFGAWGMEHKLSFFAHIIEIHEKPARPGPAHRPIRPEPTQPDPTRSDPAPERSLTAHFLDRW